MPLKDPEARRAYFAAYRETHRQERRALTAAYALSHRAEKRASSMAYRQANPEKARAVVVAWKKAHPEKARDYTHRHHIRLLDGFVEKIDIAVLVERDGGYCGICHKKVAEAERSIDHVLPVSKGGAHSYANTRLAHLRCNQARGNRGPAQLLLIAP